MGDETEVKSPFNEPATSVEEIQGSIEHLQVDRAPVVGHVAVAQAPASNEVMAGFQAKQGESGFEQGRMADVGFNVIDTSYVRSKDPNRTTKRGEYIQCSLL